jgi:hypothetical protein
MRRLSLTAFLLTAAFALAAPGLKDPPKSFAPLFNGKNLDGWHGMPHFNPYDLDKMSGDARKAEIEKWTKDAAQHWKVDDGELVNDGNGAYLTTDKDYGDIELLIDYKTVAKADSGIYLRSIPQIQIWDTTKEGGKWNLGADKGSGGLWNNSAGAPGKDPLVHADKPFGEWNSFRIIMVGERVSVWLNDKHVVNMARLDNFWNKKLPLKKTGQIQLQTHGGEIRWRNIFIREIPPTEANELLRQRDASGFVDLFNGKDLTGWAGGKEGYEVKDGLLVNQPKKGGNLFTEAEYDDFVARVEYKLPEGGNNGLAIRYPGKGQPSSEAMCEIQILDNEATKHAKIDPRQANGSIYGMVPAQRGYDRKIGEWNFMEVTVKGPKITVELNGTRITDGDVSQVKEFMGGKPHPGKDLKKGYFGFAGHGDPVAFRNIQIRPIK